MHKGQIGEVYFVFMYVIFVISLVFLTSEYVRSQSAPSNYTSYVSGNFTNQTYPQLTSSNLRNFQPPNCNLSGWGIVTEIFGIRCVVDYGVWFLSLAFMSTEFLILNLILISMSIGFVYIIIRLFRGGG